MAFCLTCAPEAVAERKRGERTPRVVVRWNLHATHTGPFAGVSPTQKKIAVRGISLYRLRDGKITETRNLADLLALFTQLGMIEQKQKAAASR